MTEQKPTVKARAHHGTKSLNLTLPAALRRKYNVQSGDVFEISVSAADEDLEIRYRRVYAQPRT